MASGMSTDRDEVLAVVARIEEDGGVSDTAARLLAESLLSIARHVMPDTYLASDSGCQLARAVLADVTKRATDAYFEDTCGDCVEGRCHWGGETSRRSTEAAKTGIDFDHPTYGRCGCARHRTSVAVRASERDTFDETVLAWQAAKDAGEVTTTEDDLAGQLIWISRPPTQSAARKCNVSDGDPCGGPAAFDVVTRSSDGKTLVSREPGCLHHAMAWADRAHAAGSMARVDVEPANG